MTLNQPISVRFAVDPPYKFIFIKNLYYYFYRKFKLLPRAIRHFCQRLCWGFDDSATWSVDYWVAKKCLPVLKRYKEIGLPSFIHENLVKNREFTIADALDDMIYAMEKTIETESATYMLTKIEQKRVDRGWRYFGQYIRYLWW